MGLVPKGNQERMRGLEFQPEEDPQRTQTLTANWTQRKSQKLCTHTHTNAHVNLQKDTHM